MRRFLPITLLLLAFLFIASLYAIFTPDWQAPDEPAHYNYIGQLAEGSFPVIEAGDYNQAYQSLVISSRFDPQYSVEPFEYEDYQPPLYYLVQTPVYLLSGGLLRALRLTSVLIGAGVVLLAYLIGRQMFPDREWLALAGAAFVAFLPQHVAMLAAINNDSLAELIIASILLLLIVMLTRTGDETPPDVSQSRLVSENEPTDIVLFLLGILLGLGFLTKVTVYILVPVIALLFLWYYWGAWRKLVRASLIIFGTAGIIGLVWWLRNLIIYDGFDFLGTAAHNAIVVGQPRTSEWIRDLGFVQTLRTFFQTTFQSFWGQFGWMGVVMPQWIYRLLLLFSILTGLGLVGWAVFKSDYQASRKAIGTIIILLGTFMMSLLVYLAYNVTFVQHQGRYLFSALIPISISVAIAWSLLISPVTNRWPSAAYLLPLLLVILLILLDIIALFRFIVPSLALN